MAQKPSRGLDRIGELWKKHLDENTSTRWRLKKATPRHYWARRFTLVAKELVTYGEIDAAFTELDGDRTLDRLMQGRSMTVWVVVWDPVEQEELLLTMAAFGDWQTAMLDMASKLDEWVTRYDSDGDSSEAFDESGGSTGVGRFIVFVGKR